MKETEGIVKEISAERARQVLDEGYAEEHDDKHTDESLAIAASCYAAPSQIYYEFVAANGKSFTDPWPWSTGFHRGDPHNGGTWMAKKGKSRRRQLVIAAALLVAEIERLDREEATP